MTTAFERPLRIAMLAPFAIGGPKGTARWRVLPLARALQAHGHQVRVVVPPYDCPGEAGRRWLDAGVEVVNVAAPRATALLLASRLAAATVSWRPDVVHSFKPKGYAGLAAGWLAQRGFPVVQDCDDWEGGWNALARYPRGWQLLFDWQERRGLRDATAVTVASRWLERTAVRLRGSGEGVVYLPNGVEMRRRDAGSHSQSATLLDQPTSLTRPKRVLLYTRFVETCAAEVWGVWSAVLALCPDATLVVVGAGAAGEERALRAVAVKSGAARSVVLLGWQPAETLPGLLTAVDAAMFPVADAPLNRAKSPMRLLDVLAAGVPVAAHAVGEYAGYIADGETGLLARSGDSASLAAAVIRLLLSPGFARSLGDQAARRCAIDHSWPRLAELALAAYRSALRATR